MSEPTANPTPELSRQEINNIFPILFSIEASHRAADRLAGVWEACGLKSEIKTVKTGYALILHHPLETGT